MFTRKFVAELKNEMQETAAIIFKIMSEQIEQLSKYIENSLYSTCHAQAVKILSDAHSAFRSVKFFESIKYFLVSFFVILHSTSIICNFLALQ